MSDLSAVIPAAPAFGQIAEGGANAHDNCIPDAFAYLAKCYGLTYVPPENWVLDEYGIPAPGATTVPNAVKEAAHIYGTNFPTSVSTGPNLSVIDAALNENRPSIILSLVNCATVRYGAGTCGHAGIVVGHSAGIWKIWNPWYGSIDSVADSVLTSNAYYQTVFSQPIGGLSMTDSEVLQKLAAQLLPQVDAGGHQVQNLAFQITDTNNHLRNVVEVLVNAMKPEVDALANHSDPAVAAGIASMQAKIDKLVTALHSA